MRCTAGFFVSESKPFRSRRNESDHTDVSASISFKHRLQVNANGHSPAKREGRSMTDWRRSDSLESLQWPG